MHETKEVDDMMSSTNDEPQRLVLRGYFRHGTYRYVLVCAGKRISTGDRCVAIVDVRRHGRGASKSGRLLIEVMDEHEPAVQISELRNGRYYHTTVSGIEAAQEWAGALADDWVARVPVIASLNEYRGAIRLLDAEGDDLDLDIAGAFGDAVNAVDAAHYDDATERPPFELAVKASAKPAHATEPEPDTGEAADQIRVLPPIDSDDVLDITGESAADLDSGGVVSVEEMIARGFGRFASEVA